MQKQQFQVRDRQIRCVPEPEHVVKVSLKIAAPQNRGEHIPPILAFSFVVLYSFEKVFVILPLECVTELLLADAYVMVNCCTTALAFG